MIQVLNATRKEIMKHLKKNERTIISYELSNGKTIKEIATILNKSISTISREIKKNKKVVVNNKVINIKNNSNYEMLENNICSLLKKPPYVCNACPRYLRNTCSYHYIIYDETISQSNYEDRIKKSKNSSTKYKEVLHILQERLDMGQPINHICQTVEFDITPSTFYNLINRNLLKYTKQKRKKSNKEIKPTEYISREKSLIGKQYIDFYEYVKENNQYLIAEMDLLCGSRFSNTYVLSIFIPKIQFLMLYKLKDKTPKSIIEVLDEIERKIGNKTFKKMLGVILTDRGSEFLKHKEIEESIKKGKRCKIFYCNASSPYQKPNIENIHRLFRRYIPKGYPFDRYTQDDFNYIASNLNSLVKIKYKNKTPNEMFLSYFNNKILKKLSLEVIEPKDICINKYLK